MISLVAAVACYAANQAINQPNAVGSVVRKNILLVVVDDLRPQLGCYDAPDMRSTTPHIDSLAKEGTMFANAYVQQSICSPTRNSFLSGRYPDKTKTWNFLNHFREAGANWTALPEFFKKNGYFTTGAGKIYHPKMPPNFDNERSWSQPWVGAFGSCGCGGKGWPPGGQATCEGLDPASLSCGDDKITRIVVGMLERARNRTLTPNPNQRWLIAAGLHKPHLPFYSTPQDRQLYPDEVAPPLNPLVPTNFPYVAWHSCLSDQTAGGNNSNWGEFTDIPNNMTFERPMTALSAARLRKGYYASVTYTDRNVGKLLSALEPMRNETLVVLIGDHGWSLGEQNVWCKMTNAENGVRVPLIIRAPWLHSSAGLRVSALAEAVDLYRTMASLSGVGEDRVEADVDGMSLAPLLHGDPLPRPRTAARSQFPRCYTALKRGNGTEHLPSLDRTDCQDVPRAQFDLMGYSIRTPSWRLTEWRLWDGQALRGRWDLTPNATELYSHATDASSASDPFATEVVNVAADPAHASTLAALRRQLRGTFDG